MKAIGIALIAVIAAVIAYFALKKPAVAATLPTTSTTTLSSSQTDAQQKAAQVTAKSGTTVQTSKPTVTLSEAKAIVKQSNYDNSVMTTLAQNLNPDDPAAAYRLLQPTTTDGVKAFYKNLGIEVSNDQASMIAAGNAVTLLEGHTGAPTTQAGYDLLLKGAGLDPNLVNTVKLGESAALAQKITDFSNTPEFQKAVGGSGGGIAYVQPVLSAPTTGTLGSAGDNLPASGGWTAIAPIIATPVLTPAVPTYDVAAGGGTGWTLENSLGLTS